MFQDNNSFDQDFEDINIDSNQNNQPQNNDFDDYIHKLNQQNIHEIAKVNMNSGLSQQPNYKQSNQIDQPNYSQNYSNSNYQYDFDHSHQNQPIQQYEPGHKKKQSTLPKLLDQDNTSQLKQDLNIKDIQRSQLINSNNYTQPVFNLQQQPDNNQNSHQLTNSITINNENHDNINNNDNNGQNSNQNQESGLMMLNGVRQSSDNMQIYKQSTQLESDEEKDPNQQVKQIEDPANSVNQGNLSDLIIIDNLQIGDMHQFITKPLQKGVLLQCTIKRDKSGITNKFYPKYHVGLSNGFKYLMSAKKKAYNKTSNYYISLSQSDPCKKDSNFVGKVRSNFMGTEFNIFDNGQNPQKANNFDQVRKQLGVVVFETNIMGTKGPRKMKVLIPDITNNGMVQEFKPINAKEGLLHNFRNNKNEGIKYLFNKPPKWNEQVNAFVLNFNGRVDKPSVKNFQLIEQSNDELVYLQFGRINKDMFNMDLQYPLSPLQAFAICLTSFDNKLACE